MQSEKRIEVTADLPFDFARTPDTTAVLWKKLGLLLPSLEGIEDQLEKGIAQFYSVSQRRLLRASTGIKKGQLLENHKFGADFQEFCARNVDTIYAAIGKLPFGFSEETIAEFARVTLIKLYQFRTSQNLLRGVDERTPFDEFIAAAEALSHSLKSIDSNASFKSRFDLDVSDVVLSALAHAGIDVHFSATKSNAPILKTLLYRGSPVEIIDLILSMFRSRIMEIINNLKSAKNIGDPSAYKFVSDMAIYWYGYTGTVPTLSRDSGTKVPRKARFKPFIEEIAPGIGESTVRAAVEFCKGIMKLKRG